MRIGVLADVHDHLDHLRRAVTVLNERRCALVLFAGDLVSSFAVPPLRKLTCPVIGCFGDNEGNKLGVSAGFRILGEIGEPPFGIRAADGTRILLTHFRRSLGNDPGEFELCIYAHTHKPKVEWDEFGRLWINPGETSGWSFGQPTIAIVETQPLSAEIVAL